MHNVDLDKLAQTVEVGRRDPGAVKQPVDLSGEWNGAGGHGGLRLRHEWSASADRQYASYAQLRRGRNESARLRLAGSAGTSLEVESAWRRREVSSRVGRGAAPWAPTSASGKG